MLYLALGPNMYTPRPSYRVKSANLPRFFGPIVT
jgi:hypothetical protein